MFVCLPALFYLGVFADHSRDWPRNVTMLCRADWTPESAMEASDFLLERSEGHKPFDGMRWQR